MKYILLPILLISIYIESFSQNNPIQFQHITAKEGLSQGHILCMMQDSEGYIWAGTFYGLNRYNGYTIDVFNAEKNNPNSIFIDMASSLLEDKDGNICVGTWGLDIFNKKTETFRHIPADAGEGTISHGGISSLALDSKGNVWIATRGGGLNKLEYKTENISYFKASQSNIKALKSDFLNNILIDKHQNLWIATEDGGLSRMNLSDESIITYLHDANDPNSIPSNKITCVFEDKDGNIWIGDANGFLSLYNSEKDNFTSYDFLFKKYKNLKIRIAQIEQDWKGDLLLATYGAGLVSYNFTTGNARISLYNSNNPNSISSNEISSIFVDKTNTIFAGSFGRGISKYSPFNRKFETHFIPKSYKFEGDINSFTDAAEDKSNHLIVCTYYGIVVFDKKTWEYKHYLPGDTYKENKILTITIAPDESIWLGSMSGLHRYDKNFNKIRSYIFDTSLNDHSIYTIEFDHKNNLWIGLFTKGLLKISESEWKDKSKNSLDYKIYQTDYNNQKSISGNQNWIIYVGKDSSLWLGNEGGLCEYNYESDDFTRCFNTGLGAVKKIEIDSKGKIWMGTIGKGIYSFDRKNNTFKEYTTKDGLCHNFVYGLIIDKKENIWLSTESGLSQFNIETESFRNFDEKDGLPHNHFDDASDSKLSDGRIYMGTINGFMIFDPDKITADSSETRVVLTSLEINNQTQESYKNVINDSIIDVPIAQITTIKLAPGQRDFSLKFAALNYVAPHKIKYAYKLEGYDNDWIFTDAENRIAHYTNLDGGTYTFFVKSTNADGKWAKQPLEISIKVNPPFYKTIWFGFIILALFFLLTFLIFRSRIAREIKQKEILARKVDDRTIEITNKNTLLKQTADNLTKLNTVLKERQYQIELQAAEIASQRDNLEITNATKDKLFSIIAHDLKNPFNVILGFTDLIIENFDTWEEKQKLKVLNLVKDSSNNAFNLLENLLNWSRSQSGTIEFNPKNVLVSSMVGIVFQEVSLLAIKKEIEITNLAKDKNLQVNGDKDMLALICRNLLMNAIKFSSPAGKIYFDVKEFNPEYLCLSIQDEGVGIPAEKISNLFNLGNNYSTHGTAGEKGTGLGLILCKEFVAMHGGEIWAESKENMGTTIFFTIPKG